MISKIFESEKGEAVGRRRTICEIHREIFDELIINFHGRPKSIKKIIKLLEEAFVVGVKINEKLTEHKLDAIYDDNEWKSSDVRREKRKLLVKMLNENKKFLKQYG